VLLCSSSSLRTEAATRGSSISFVISLNSRADCFCLAITSCGAIGSVSIFFLACPIMAQIGGGGNVSNCSARRFVGTVPAPTTTVFVPLSATQSLIGVPLSPLPKLFPATLLPFGSLLRTSEGSQRPGATGWGWAHDASRAVHHGALQRCETRGAAKALCWGINQGYKQNAIEFDAATHGSTTPHRGQPTGAQAWGFSWPQQHLLLGGDNVLARGRASVVRGQEV